MMLWITSLALAAPDRVAAELTDVTGTDELRVLESADLVAVLDGTNVHLLDLETWDVYTASSGCSGGLALWEAEDGTPTLAVGCSDGSVASMTWDGSALSGVTNTDLLIGTVYSMEYGGSYLFAVASGTGNPVSWSIDTSSDPWTTLEDAGDGGNTLPNSSTPTHMASASGYVYITHASSSISKIDSSTGSVSDDGATSAPSGNYGHVATWASSSNALLTDSQGEMAIYQPSSQSFSTPLDELDSPSCSSIGGDGSYVAIAESEVVSFWDWSESSFSFNDTSTPLAEVDVSSYDEIDRLVAVEDYLIAGTAGSLLVMTELSWIEISSDHSSSIDGDTSLSFSSDTDGDYTVSVGEPGTELASGSISADASETVDIAAEDLDEGVNRIWVVLDDGGYDAVDITVDTPTPDAEVVGVGGGDAVIYLTLAAHGASDVDDVEIYLSSTTWEIADYASQSLATYAVDASEGESDDLRITLTGVENYTTYYVAARWDAGGDTGGWTDVVEATPVPTRFVTCEMRTDGECPTCGTSSGGSALGVLGLLGLAGLVRRRRGLFATCLGLVALSPGLAQAQELPSAAAVPEPHDFYVHNKDRTTELRFGPSSIDAPEFDVAYDRLITVHLDGGIQLARFVELNGGLGLSRPVGNALAYDGDSSDETSRANLFPVSAGLTFRLDPALRLGENFRPLDYGWYGMPVVPYVSVGATAWPYIERKGSFSIEDPLAASSRTGGVPGTWYWAAGADILLDWMDPKHAAVAETRWGIVDTYFTIEYRKGSQLWGPLDYGGDAWTAGIKVDRR